MKVRRIELLYYNQPSRRKVKVTLTNGTRIYIVRFHEAWQQYGGTMEELQVTMPIAWQYNEWLHEGIKEG